MYVKRCFDVGKGCRLVSNFRLLHIWYSFDKSLEIIMKYYSRNLFLYLIQTIAIYHFFLLFRLKMLIEQVKEIIFSSIRAMNFTMIPLSRLFVNGEVLIRGF